MLAARARSLTASLLSVGLAVTALPACQTLDGKAERHLVTTEPMPASLEISSRFLDVTVSLATSSQVGIDASVYLQTSGGNETAEREIEHLNVFVVREGDKLIVRQGEPNQTWSFNGSYSGRGRLDVTVPANLPFSVATASGDVTIKGDYGAVDLRVTSASGDIACSDLGVRSLTARTASGDGDIALSRALDRFEWRAASGDLDLRGGAAQASAESASGDVILRGLAGPISISTASGDVVLVLAESAAFRDPLTRIALATASGDVELTVPADLSPGGTISTASGTIDVPTSWPHEASRRVVKLTGAGATIECTTASGDVTFRK